MKIFTYDEYIKYIHTLRLNAVFKLAEESSGYQLTKQKKGDNLHDKLVKKILKNKIEMEKFIRQFISTKLDVANGKLIKFPNSYITKKYKSKEADLVYKLEGQDIFFLIEHQSSVDIRMPYRILNYCIDIMYEWCRSKKLKQIKKYPIIVPIVIYTGDRKWNVPKNFSETQISTEILKNYKINIQYNLVDINQLSDNFLLEQNTMFGYGMLIEKAKDKNELLIKLDSIVQNCNNKEQLYELEDIVLYALDNALCNIEQEIIIEKIHKKVGEESMSTLIDRLTAENKRILKQGRDEGMRDGIKNGIKTGIKTGMKNGIQKNKKEVIERMLSMNFEEDIILKISGATKQELEKVKEKKAI